MSQEFNEEYAQSEFTEEYQSEYQSEHESENIMITPGTCLYSELSLSAPPLGP